MKQQPERFDAYQALTDTIVAELEKGLIPWQRPWRTKFSGSLPHNYQTKRFYNGINLLLLAMAPFSDPRWMTFKQVKECGGHVRKGEKGTKIMFWKMIEITAEESDTGVAKTIPYVQIYTVFNMEQTEGIAGEALPGFEEETLFAPTVNADHVFENMPQAPALSHGGDRAYYRPSTDEVQMPTPDSFFSGDAYYHTLFHELAHSTGHESRLNRKGVIDIAAFGDEVYSQEELVAEMTAAFVCDAAGVPVDLPQTSAYIGGWLKALKNDKKMLVFAASQAQKASDFILGLG
jgi:antirestriction protein ArdC